MGALWCVYASCVGAVDLEQAAAAAAAAAAARQHSTGRMAAHLLAIRLGCTVDLFVAQLLRHITAREIRVWIVRAEPVACDRRGSVAGCAREWQQQRNKQCPQPTAQCDSGASSRWRDTPFCIIIYGICNALGHTPPLGAGVALHPVVLCGFALPHGSARRQCDTQKAQSHNY
jgi:hypothetical protein